MKIAIVVPVFPTISETFILNHITGLMDEGHTVTIVALRENTSSQRHQIIDDYQLLSRTLFVKKPPSKKVLCRLYTAFQIVLHGLRCPSKTLKALRYLLFVNQAEFYQKLFFFFAVIHKEHDIFHFHFGQTGRLGAVVKKMGTPIRMVTSVHGYDVNRIPLQKGVDYYSELFVYGDHFIANTEFTKTQVVNLGCDASTISVIPVGLHVRDFPFKARKIDDNETVQILTVGRLVEKKGYQYSIRAIARLIKEGFNIHYTIAGGGPLRKELEQLTQNMGISEQVSFIGETTQEEVIKLYERSHLFVLSSVTAKNGDKEGQALVLQEAQACGLPVVSTLHNGIPDGVLDGQSGYLVPEKDTDALSNATKRLMLNPSCWKEMGEAGREFVQRKYETKNLTSQLIKLYETLKSPSR